MQRSEGLKDNVCLDTRLQCPRIMSSLTIDALAHTAWLYLLQRLSAPPHLPLSALHHYKIPQTPTSSSTSCTSLWHLRLFSTPKKKKTSFPASSPSSLAYFFLSSLEHNQPPPSVTTTPTTLHTQPFTPCIIFPGNCISSTARAPLWRGSDML